MYDKRIKIFIILIAILLLICLLRIIQMQLLPDSSLQDDIAKLKLQKGLSRQLKTVRGKILDRKDRIIAVDEPQFQLHINYRLSSFWDGRVRRAKVLRAAEKRDADLALSNVQEELETKLDDLQQIIEKCTYFGFERTDIENRIKTINNKTWNSRTFLAWRRSYLDQNILKKYNNEITNIPASVAFADFKKKVPNENQRLLLTAKVDDIPGMDKNWPLLELKTDDDIFTAQFEFLNIDGISILPKAHRFYPYGSVAAQTIGWVGPATQKEDIKLFKGDKLSSYLSDEVCGREDGAEYVCETILRGRRGEVVYDIDRQLINRTETRFGKDVSLTLDIALQQRIEQYLADCDLNPNCKAPTAAVVIEVASGDILALVSIPNFDLNRTRYDYNVLKDDPNKPLINRAIYKQYPPGSVIKPLILIAGLEAGKITPDEIIPCPAQKARKGWPSCWLYNRYSWMGHDDKGQNNARNAVKGSCNIYFSRLANRIDPSFLQQWLFKFGYGHKIPLVPAAIRETGLSRNLRQAPGQISTIPPKSTISSSEQLTPIENRERRYFGIGQGNLRTTPLQVANAMAAIARGGLYKSPGLFLGSQASSIDLNISPQTLEVVYDGMSAVVNEPDGTAYKEFAHAGFDEQGIKVHGKTGSTEEPDHAWFAGFATDRTDRSVAIAIVVEGGQHGSSDASPLARDIIQFCIDAGYMGQSSDGVVQEPKNRTLQSSSLKSYFAFSYPEVVKGFFKYSGYHRSSYGPAGIAFAELDVRSSDCN
jgi:penicillin-binding protein 2